jgi:hypothetical protein
MGRVSEKDVRELAEHVAKVTGLPISAQWAYGRPRVELKVGPRIRDLSPRLPTGQMQDWLFAFLKGFEMAYEQIEKKGS